MPYTEWRGNFCRVRWKTGRTKPNGKPEYDSQGGFTNEETAYNYGLDRESDVRNTRYISRRDGNILMSAYCPKWLQTQDVGHLRWRQIDQILRNHIVPYWGEYAVGEIKASDHRTWTLHLARLPNVGDAYAKEILLVFSMVMDDAVDDGLRSNSPVKKKSRRGKYKKTPREKKRDMLIEDVHQLALNALVFWGFPGYVFFLTKPFTCMRPGELYALRREFCHPNWPASDPDLERGKEAMERYGPVDLAGAPRQWQFQRVRQGTGEALPAEVRLPPQPRTPAVPSRAARGAPRDTPSRVPVPGDRRRAAGQRQLQLLLLAPGRRWAVGKRGFHPGSTESATGGHLPAPPPGGPGDLVCR